MENTLQSLSHNNNKNFLNLPLDSAEAWRLPRLGLISH